MLSTGPERGSAVVGSIFAIVFVMLAALAVVQVALSLYARNAVASAAHEGARRALEIAATEADAQDVALTTVRDSVGGLLDELRVAAATDRIGSKRVVVVRLRGALLPLGPVPYSMSFDARATAAKEVRP